MYEMQCDNEGCSGPVYYLFHRPYLDQRQACWMRDIRETKEPTATYYSVVKRES